jgi:transaldolase
MTPLASLIATGTKLWLDSIDPKLVVSNRQAGATGATSNPIIVADLIKTGRFDDQLASLMRQGLNDHDVAWKVTDQLVQQAQQVFLPVWEQTRGNDGYVSFELDPLLEDASCPLSTAERAAQYVILGKQWAAGHNNRMIKVPATPAGLAALTDLAAAGIPLNVTLIFSAAAERPGEFQIGLQHFCQPDRRLHQAAGATTFGRRPGTGGPGQRQAAVGRE